MDTHDEPLPAADELLASIFESIKLKEMLVGAADGQAHQESAQAGAPRG